MITEIGVVAGKILELLEERNGTLIFGEMHEDLKQPRDFVLMSLGWLINENYVFLMEDPSAADYWDDRTATYTSTADISDLIVGNQVITATSKRTKNILDHLSAVTGKILILLEGCGGVLDLEIIECNISEHRDIILMGLGWLIREGYVQGMVGTHEIFLFYLPKETVSLKVESFCHQN